MLSVMRPLPVEVPRLPPGPAPETEALPTLAEPISRPPPTPARPAASPLTPVRPTATEVATVPLVPWMVARPAFALPSSDIAEVKTALDSETSAVLPMAGPRRPTYDGAEMEATEADPDAAEKPLLPPRTAPPLAPETPELRAISDGRKFAAEEGALPPPTRIAPDSARSLVAETAEREPPAASAPAFRSGCVRLVAVALLTPAATSEVRVASLALLAIRAALLFWLLVLVVTVVCEVVLLFVVAVAVLG